MQRVFLYRHVTVRRQIVNPGIEGEGSVGADRAEARLRRPLTPQLGLALISRVPHRADKSGKPQQDQSANRNEGADRVIPQEVRLGFRPGENRKDREPEQKHT